MTTNLACANAGTDPHAVGNQNRIVIEDAWVRATNPGQRVGAAYMTLTSTENLTLTNVESDVTDSVEIHSMTMQNGVMKMRMLDTLTLTKGKPYQLAPGGFHFMLFDLKEPLQAGSDIRFVLHFKTTEDNKPLTFQQVIKVKVRNAAPMH